MMNKIFNVLLTVFALIGAPAVLVWAFVEATNTPDVIFSYSTKQCIKVINADGSEGTCDHLPKKFNHIWGK